MRCNWIMMARSTIVDGAWSRFEHCLRVEALSATNSISKSILIPFASSDRRSIRVDHSVEATGCSDVIKSVQIKSIVNRIESTKFKVTIFCQPLPLSSRTARLPEICVMSLQFWSLTNYNLVGWVGKSRLAIEKSVVGSDLAHIHCAVNPVLAESFSTPWFIARFLRLLAESEIDFLSFEWNRSWFVDSFREKRRCEHGGHANRVSCFRWWKIYYFFLCSLQLQHRFCRGKRCGGIVIETSAILRAR